MKLYSYIIKHDAGSAPNPFWSTCSLAICKPVIRRGANVGDWVIGTGSKNAKCNDLQNHDLSGCLVFAMRVTSILSMKEYDEWSSQNCPRKIPNWKTKDWRDKVGDCVYDFSTLHPSIRRSVHNESNAVSDLGGINVLLSNSFYYFGEEPIILPSSLQHLVKATQGHLKCEDPYMIEKFEKWIDQFKKNKIYASPQLRWKFDKHMTTANKMKCI